MDKKSDKSKQESNPRDDCVELENQFILRLPAHLAKLLQEALQNGNLKDRLSIKMDQDLRFGEVRFDQYLLHTKIVDFPTIIECHKTIDAKNFYKSADVCQMMICKLEPDPVDIEKESPNKSKKKDSNKVDKKYLWPHGLTPPCKNVRKRRFRKTLKKKNIEAPEIEKEVKRLLRIDNDAVKVDYEIINEDVEVDKSMPGTNSKEYNDEFNEDAIINDPDEKVALNDSSSQKDINVESDEEGGASGSAPTMHGGVGEHDIFGEVSSSGDDDDERQDEARRCQENEESSRLSADDSHISDYYMGVGTDAGIEVCNESRVDGSYFPLKKTNDPIEFNKSMFTSIPKSDTENDKSNSNFDDSNSITASTSVYFGSKQNTSSNFKEDCELSFDAPNLNAEEIKIKITELRRHYDDLKMQQAQKAQEISSIQNPTLRQRMQETLDNLLTQMVEKDLEIKNYENML